MVTYGGDEVSALVLDVGTITTRAGYAGEDAPKCVMPSQFGYIDTPVEGSSNEVTDAAQPAKTTRKYFVGEEGVNVWRSGMEVGSLVADGLVVDQAALPEVVHHALHDRLRVNPADHPVLTTEPAWNTPQHRLNMAQIMFEQESVPAWYTANNAVLSSFASGRGTALIVDIGSDLISVTPIYEGYVLRGGVRRQPGGMKLVESQMKGWLTTNPDGSRNKLDLTPHHLITARTPVPPRTPAKYTLREDRVEATTKSWREYQENKIAEGWREAVSGVLEGGYDERNAESRPLKAFEFPTGYNCSYGSERFKIPEILMQPQHFFNRTLPIPPSLLATIPSPNSRDLAHLLPLPQLIQESVMSSDVDIRGPLLANIIIVGSGSLLPGLIDRTSWELGRLMVGQKVKIQSPGNLVERKFSTWLGGSILASLGTFHQLWITKGEYEEHGESIITQRCK